MKKLLLALALLALPLAFAQSSGGEPLSGGAPSGGAAVTPKVQYFAPGESLPDGSYAVWAVPDGDTIHVVAGDTIRPIRIFGVQTPELRRAGQVGPDAFALEAKDFATTLMLGTTVTTVSQDPLVERFGRALSKVTLEDGRDYGLVVLQAGLADVYLTDDPLYWAARDGARSVAKGVWQGQALKDYNCKDFGTRAAAQAFYDAATSPDRPDPSRLDLDRNGLACESLRR